MKSKYILGVTGLSKAFHDNSAVLLKDGKVVFAASEERYSRIKHDRSFPILAIKQALKYAKIKSSDISYLAVGYPNRSFMRPFLSSNFLDLTKVSFDWLKGRGIYFFNDVFNIIKGELIQNNVSAISKKLIKDDDMVVYVDHHLAHTASAYYSSGFENCIGVSLDAFGPKVGGEIISGSVYRCVNTKITENLDTVAVESSIGLFYTSVTQALGFTPGDGEGKTMGLAAYGKPDKTYKELKYISPNFNKGVWNKSPYWIQMFFANRKEFKPIFDSLPLGKILNNLIIKYGKENVAAGAQKVLEVEVVKYFEYLVNKFGVNKFVLAGGLFLNVKMNMRIREISGIDEIFIQPNAGDGGTALGAAYYTNAEKYGYKKMPDQIKNVSWGSSFSQSEIKRALKKYNRKISFTKEKNIAKTLAKKLVEGKVIGRFNGGFEWGPRALGYRSVLIDPRRMDIKEILNNTLKNREWFMPFAPSILTEYGKDYFDKFVESPFMTIAFNTKKNKVKDIKAAIHIDNTARPNSVSKKDNPSYYNVINEFFKLTGIPVVLNTSFNKHGLPIVNSPEDAIDHLLWNCIDELAIGDYLVSRKE